MEVLKEDMINNVSNEEGKGVPNWWWKIVLYSTVSCIIAGIGTLIYQVFLWLKNGHWTPIPTSLVFTKILPVGFFQWLDNETWLGLKTIISVILRQPFSGFLLALAVFIFVGSGLVLGIFQGLSPTKKKDRSILQA